MVNNNVATVSRILDQKKSGIIKKVKYHHYRMVNYQNVLLRPALIFLLRHIIINKLIHSGKTFTL